MDKKTTALIICAIVIIMLGGMLVYNYIETKQEDKIQNITITSYNQGAFDGQLLVIQQIQQTGNIPVLTGQGNQTQIQWININQICQGG